jgi:hypothetical protein
VVVVSIEALNSTSLLPQTSNKENQMTTIQNMIDHSNINSNLIRNAVKQFGGFSEFKDAAPDVTRNGIDGGFSGWIYYADTLKFYNRNREAIIEMAIDQAEDLGIDSLEMIQGFGVFRNDPISKRDIAKALYGKNDDATIVQNVMAWYVAEEVARLYCDLNEEENSN